MSDRLTELQRQRTLVQEQLAWLEKEIAREAGRTAPAPSPVIKAPPAPVSATAAARTAEEILAQYQSSSQTTTKDVKRGCYLYFLLAFALLGLGVTVIYFLRLPR